MRFILTKELGRLSRWLRILGFDTVYFKEDNYSKLLLLALREERIIITRNKTLAEKVAIKAVYLKEERLPEQLKKVIKRLNLKIEENKMFSRCVICNKSLEKVEKERVKERVPEYVYKTQQDFMECPQCKRVYWPGSHWQNIREALNKTGLNG